MADMTVIGGFMDVRSRVRRWRMRKHQYACELSAVDLFADCTVNQLCAVAQLICPLTVEPGRVVAREGDPCSQFVLVVSGEAETSTAVGSAGVLEPGAMIGEAAVDPGRRHSTTVTARTPMDLLVASRPELIRIIRLAPSVEQKLIARLAPELRFAPVGTVPAPVPGRWHHRPAA